MRALRRLQLRLNKLGFILWFGDAFGRFGREAWGTFWGGVWDMLGRFSWILTSRRLLEVEETYKKHTKTL